MSLLMACKCYRAGQGRRLKQSISLGVVVYPRGGARDDALYPYKFVDTWLSKS